MNLLLDPCDKLTKILGKKRYIFLINRRYLQKGRDYEPVSGPEVSSEENKMPVRYIERYSVVRLLSVTVRFNRIQ